MSINLLKKVFYRNQKRWLGSLWFQIFKKKVWFSFLNNHRSRIWFKYFNKALCLVYKEPSLHEKLNVLNINKSFKDFTSSFIFLNDRLIYKSTKLVNSLSNNGVELLTKYSAIFKNAWWMQKYTCNFSFCSRDDTTNQLNNILSSNGFVLFVGEGVRVETPISVYFYYTKKVNSFYAPSNLIVLGGKSSCSVNVYYKSLYKCDRDLNSLVLDSTNTIVNKNSYLKLTSFKHLEGFTNFQTNDFVAYQKALLNVCNINIKAPFNFLKNHTVLKGPGSNINLTGLNILGNSGYVKNVIQQTHLVPNCKSSVLFKNIVPDNAKSTFSGLILIDKKAHGTVAKQLNNNMCFGSNVEVYSTPKLEILSNNVRCLHGVTIGGLDSLDTLYAASRCLDKLGVTQLFVLGFINSILKEISIKKIKKLVYKRVELLIKKPYNTTI